MFTHSSSSLPTLRQRAQRLRRQRRCRPPPVPKPNRWRCAPFPTRPLCNAVLSVPRCMIHRLDWRQKMERKAVMRARPREKERTRQRFIHHGANANLIKRSYGIDSTNVCVSHFGEVITDTDREGEGSWDWDSGDPSQTDVDIREREEKQVLPTALSRKACPRLSRYLASTQSDPNK